MVSAKKLVPRAKKPGPSDTARVIAASAPVLRSPQDAPVLLKTAEQKIVGALKIDTAVITRAGVKLQGWAVGAGALQLECDGSVVPSELTRTSRPDVAIAMKLPEPGSGFGFTLTAGATSGSFMLRLELDVDGETQRLHFPLKLQRPPVLGPGGLAGAVGFLEAASASTITHDGVVVGWSVNEPDATVWLQTDAGDKFFLDSTFRFGRQDVSSLHSGSFGANAREGGFIARLKDVQPGTPVRLMGEKDSGPIMISEVVFGALPSDAAAASQWLFGLGTPASQLVERYPAIDAPILEGLLQEAQRAWADLPVVGRSLGEPVTQPLASVIVPLYGRSDFVEHQLMEFSRDADFQRHAELIYVLDDPALVEPFVTQADWLYKLYGVPFRWIWGGINRGFSGANNLGAAHASGTHLVFLNSDVIPQEPGWLMPMLEVLQKNAKVGAVGARLTFADGSIQHAGMCFKRRDDLGVWVNEHPQMGLDPSLDRHSVATTMPAVTGACLAMRRQDFELVGGWETGYLIGDFEDSDLCLKLRASNLASVYLPSVQLTHLERQSFKLLGSGEYRMRVVIYNALRHQQRWQHLIDSEFQHVPV
jgi:GT2 family glycosyltransferase